MLNKNRFKFILFVSVLFSNTLTAQELSVEWIKQAGGVHFDKVDDMVSDREGNLVLMGSFVDSTVFESNQIKSTGKKSLFIAKYNKEGELLWIQGFGLDADVTANSVCMNSQSEIYICGSFKNEMTFGKTKLKAEAFSNQFLAKLDKEANPIWIKQFNADTKGKKSFVACDNEDYVYYGGSYYKEFPFETVTLVSEAGTDMFVSKFDGDGKLINATGIKGKNTEILNDMKCTGDGRLIITGSFNGTLILGDTPLTSSGDEDVFIAEMKDFTFGWANQAGGFYKDYGMALHIKGDRIYLTGSFSAQASFDKTKIASQGVLDAFAACYDTNGKLKWVNGFGSTGNDYTRSISVNTNGNVYITGSYRGSFKQNDGTVESQKFSSDIYTAKFSPTGEFLGGLSFGGDAHDFASGIQIDEENYIYQSGKFDFDFSLNQENKVNGNSDDVFLGKYYDCDAAEKVRLGDDVIIYADSYTIQAIGNFQTYEWNNGSTESYLKVDESGEFWVKTTDDKGCISQDTIQINLFENTDTYKDDFSNQSDAVKLFTVNLSPNPANERFLLDIQNIDTRQSIMIGIVDENGKSIYQTSTSTASESYMAEIRVDHLSAGVFHVIVINGTNRTDHKLVIYKN
jgi:hypothetical protein